MPTTAIATDRLDLPPLTPAALQALIEADPDRLTALTGAVFPLPVEAPPLMGDALPFFRDRLRDHPEEAAWWARLLVRRDTREAVGSAGFAGPPDETGTVTVGYAVYPACQGLGFATEAVRVLVLWALAQPGVARVRATIPPNNAPSRRVAERAGLRPVGTAHDAEAGEVEVWEIAARTPGSDRPG
jgi:ribosomal-protein-alanine N-acetyltransferase